jgi:hypothetical protein
VRYWRAQRAHVLVCALVCAYSPTVRTMNPRDAALLVLGALQSIATSEELYGEEAKRFAQG